MKKEQICVGHAYTCRLENQVVPVRVLEDLEPKQCGWLVEVLETGLKAEVEGKVAEILVENGQPVEFGQPLFRIEKP